MTNRHTPNEQFQVVEALLKDWLKERQDLLACYTRLVSASGPGGNNTSPTACRDQQAALCELLVDYVSAGHFEVFIKLVEEAESFADGSETLAKQLMPNITDTTEFILAYEEKYARNEHGALPAARDISALGEVLETRLTLEDQLISRLHNKHRRLVETPM